MPFCRAAVLAALISATFGAEALVSGARAQQDLCATSGAVPIFPVYQMKLMPFLQRGIALTNASLDESKRQHAEMRENPDEWRALPQSERTRRTFTQRICDIAQAQSDLATQELAVIEEVKEKCGGFSSFSRMTALGEMKKREQSTRGSLDAFSSMLKGCAEAGVTPHPERVASNGAPPGAVPGKPRAIQGLLKSGPDAEKFAAFGEQRRAQVAARLIATTWGARCHPVSIANGALRMHALDHVIRRLERQWNVRCAGSDLAMDYVVEFPAKGATDIHVLQCLRQQGFAGVSCSDQRQER